MTFDRTMGRGNVAELHHIDPDRRAVSLDLPGRESPDQSSYDLEPLVERVHAAAQSAGLDATRGGRSLRSRRDRQRVRRPLFPAAG